MPITLYSETEQPPAHNGWHTGGASLPRSVDGSSPGLVIGLLNNMPDAALQATEQQFRSLLDAASTDISVQLVLCRMPLIPRSQAADDYLRRSYVAIDSVLDTEIDGLIVTGREPLTPDLRDEPYWDSFVQVLEWSRRSTASTIWSCLAAHAAVLHLDGIQRLRGEYKQCGIFHCSRTSNHPLVAHLPEQFRMPHSRWNGLPKDDLACSGYELLALAGDAGVDCFLRQKAGESLFLFFQGHPEYQPDTLLLEYRRDILRYLRGEAAAWPGTPRGMLTPKDETALLELGSQAHVRSEEETLAGLMRLFSAAGIENGWHGTATTIYRNWLEYLSAQKTHRAASREPAPLAPSFGDAAGQHGLQRGSFS
ncbi:MAG TPA: homoserine O-succinyltransferase [Acidobacteriaceae bacterium]|nr:homoserine O-succinyltransferase [Acidobacteriaceae bacterium]